VDGLDILSSLDVWNYLSEDVRKRLSSVSLETTCHHQKLLEFWALQKKRNPLGGVVVWNCRSGEICGGNGDRLRGISGALFNAVRLGYDLFIRWDNPVSMD